MRIEQTACDPDALTAMEQSLELVAAAGIDIVPRFFARFYALLPAEQERFCNRTSSEGLMVNEMLAMLLASARDEPWLRTMMRAQVNTHHDHGDILLGQYRDTLDLLIAVVRDAVGPDWTPAFERAWQRQASALFAIIERCY